MRELPHDRSGGRMLSSRLGLGNGSMMWLVIVAVVAFAVSKGHRRSTRQPGAAGASPALGTATPADAVPTRAAALQLAGQHVIYAYAGTTPPPALIEAIRSGLAAGVILFGSNTADPAALGRAVAAMQAAAQASPLAKPILILTDQEGGAVRRLPGAPVDSEKAIGEAPNAPALATAAGTGAAATLTAAGVDVNLAPVLDVYRRRGDFIDAYGRSYSENPTVVSRLGADFITAQQRAGIAATAKHFPGLGSAGADQDTDARPVRLGVGLSQLRRVDEAPYRAAITAGVRLVMLSWATYPALDPSHPAGLSSRVINRELRGRLGFGGVTITDAIDAGALVHFGDIAARSVDAIGAGDDLILACAAGTDKNSPAIGSQAVHAIAAALMHHGLSLSALEASGRRVLALRG